MESTKVGIRISFRTYSLENESGGYETTACVEGANLSQAPAFCGRKHEIKEAASVFGAKVVSITVNNKVPVLARFTQVSHLF